MHRLIRTAAFCLALAVPMAAASRPPAPTNSDPRTIAHVLNRIGFGARPGDVENVRAIGLDRYIDQQLHPDRVSDNALAPRLGGLASINLSSHEIAQQYERPLEEMRRQRKANDNDSQ